MAAATEKITEMQGYKLHVIETEKYKTNTLVWRMKAPLTKEDVTKRALLPQVLQSSSAKYPSTTILRAYLDELYGATLFVDLAKKGEYHVISFLIEIANEKFLTDPTPLLKKGLELLTEILTNPNASGHGFDRETVEKEKRTLKQRIQSVYDDKMRYSNVRLIEEMCKGEPYALQVNGDLEDVDSITPENLFAYFQKAFSQDEMDLYVVGDVKAEEVTEIVSGLLQFDNRTPQMATTQDVEKRSKVNEVKEVQNVKQGKLNIGYRTNSKYGEPDYFTLQVFNGIFGGFSHSKLFINVREKASLAYYAASRLESHKGLMMVMSGIDIKNYDQAVGIIHEQMEAMKKGDFTDEELTQTKAVIRNQILETLDTSRGLLEILYHNVVAHKDITINDWLTEMEKVTRNEIIQVAGKIDLDTIYFLTGSEEGK
ncbi:pitrilysin family protein [Neobacillus sp. OS1-32]|uniref:EF-P 5-aminopentanol modification-associated protein YfmF n=1 Tax=Neobacillus sp. OS1-32 TaxID=3070682 RepID=UPI0027DF273E|nr:pitrilysin family protein [Neobacillus sp. OS1-32]WML31791.1 pitrilysin family protein [Neobacillus sp. OS1-32]